MDLLYIREKDPEYYKMSINANDDPETCISCSPVYLRIEKEMYEKNIVSRREKDIEMELSKCPKCNLETLSVSSFQIRRGDEPETVIERCKNIKCRYYHKS